MRRINSGSVVVLSVCLALSSACKPRKSSKLAGAGGSCGECCDLDPDEVAKKGTPEALREAARLKVFLMKEAFENGNPMAMIILAKLMRSKMTGEALTIEQHLQAIDKEMGGKFLNKSITGGVDQQIDEAALKVVADEMREGLLKGSAAIPGDRSLTASNANLQEVLTDGLLNVKDANGRKIMFSDIQDVMKTLFEVSGTESFGQKSRLNPSQALVMVDMFVDSVIGAKMDYVVVGEDGSARAQLPFDKGIEIEVAKSYADAIYAKVARLSAMEKVDASELDATKKMLETFREATQDKSQMAEVDAALEVLKKADKAAIEALREGKVQVNGKEAAVRFEEGFSPDKFSEIVRKKGQDWQVRKAFREADRSVRK